MPEEVSPRNIDRTADISEVGAGLEVEPATRTGSAPQNSGEVGRGAIQYGCTVASDTPASASIHAGGKGLSSMRTSRWYIA